MSRSVPTRRVDGTVSEIRAAATVRGLTFDAAANNSNWLLGRGSMLVPGYTPNAILVDGDPHDFRFKAPANEAALERFWSFRFDGPFTGAPAIEVPIGGASVTGTIPAPFALREAVSSPSTGVVDLSFRVTPGINEGAPVVLNYVSCQEVPRAILEDSEDGVELADLEPGDPITLASLDNLGTVARAPNLGRRSLVQWAVPDALPAEFTTSTFVDLWALPQMILGRTVYGDTKRNVRVYAYCRIVSGGTGEIRVTPSKGSALTVTGISGAAFAWLDLGTISVDAEDLSTSDGLRSATYETVRVECRRLTSGTFQLASISMIEDAV